MFVRSLTGDGRKSNRPGLTLFEVVVALSIFVVAMVPLWQLVNIGTERAEEIQMQAQASILCQGKMAEVIAGAETLESVGATPFKEESVKDWQWQMDASEDISGLWKVRLTVQRPRSDGSMLEATITQMVLDPSIRGSTLTSSSPSSSSSSDAASSPSSGSTTGGATSGGAAASGAGGGAAAAGAGSKAASGAGAGVGGASAGSTGSKTGGSTAKGGGTGGKQ